MHILGCADRIIATSPRYIETSPYLSRFQEKCVVIPLGIEVERFAQADTGQVEVIRQRYGTPLLLFVGKPRYYKGIPYPLEAMKRIEATLLIVGSGPTETEWKKTTERLNLGHKVFFVGEVDEEELPAFYHACDLFVLPASHRSEAFGIVQLEAVAAGKPVISAATRWDISLRWPPSPSQ